MACRGFFLPGERGGRAGLAAWQDGRDSWTLPRRETVLGATGKSEKCPDRPGRQALESGGRKGRITACRRLPAAVQL